MVRARVKFDPNNSATEDWFGKVTQAMLLSEKSKLETQASAYSDCAH